MPLHRPDSFFFEKWHQGVGQTISLCESFAKQDGIVLALRYCSFEAVLRKLRLQSCRWYLLFVHCQAVTGWKAPTLGSIGAANEFATYQATGGEIPMPGTYVGKLDYGYSDELYLSTVQFGKPLRISPRLYADFSPISPQIVVRFGQVWISAQVRKTTKRM